MQFFKSAVVAAVAFAAVVVAAPAPAGESLKRECKPILESCAVDSECCADLCVAGLCL
ncbi:hypothetical protein FIBSPDRAFT_875119 [Athelia psychrophila]|uniref:Uncharacterized protein n=1 Tax=Athelia psychrophila TaxID=1759441 RepID=A0A165WNU2_9AGAM|nr:hypothetical protein FIBSPDRAFT_875119 [Fibularhizoctonia sp. CBS 109695]